MYKWKAVGRILSSAALGSPCKGFGITSSRSSCSTRGISQVSSFPALLNNNYYFYKPPNNMPTRGFFFYSTLLLPPVRNPKPMYTDPAELRSSIVNVGALLSKNSKWDFLVNKAGSHVPISSLAGKYVLVCCFSHPNDSCQDIIRPAVKQLCSEMSSSGMNNFHMVIAVQFPRPWGEDTEAAFTDFFSGFPDNCLAIPFSDQKLHEHVCKFVKSELRDTVMLVNPAGKICEYNDEMCCNYGADSYPFYPQHFRDLDQKDEMLKLRLDSYGLKKELKKELALSFELKEWEMALLKKGLTLSCLLQCNSFSRIGNESEQVATQYFDGKFVGVYLYANGLFMHHLSDVHQQCMAEDRSLEIVLVCITMDEDPHKILNEIALKKNNISSWWKVPYNDKVSRALWRIYEKPEGDRLIILPPDCGNNNDNIFSADLHGTAIIGNYGIAAYPFTKEAIINKWLSTLKSLTLESLLSQGTNFLVPTNAEGGGSGRVPLDDLRGKNILLLLDYFVSDCFDYKRRGLYELLQSRQNQIKAQHPGTQVVVVPLDEDDPGLLESTVPCEGFKELPCLMLPSPASASAVWKQLFVKDMRDYPHATLVAFGKDGHILSKSAQTCLSDDHIDVASLFDDKLRQEIVKIIASSDYSDPY